jgi:ABC-2 type transport system permease protein
MKLYRIKAVFLRHIILIPRDLFRYIDLIYWPLLDIILWGITAFWIQKGTDNLANIPLLLLTGLVLWFIVYRAHLELALGLLDEFWSHNMVNLFSSSLTVAEWLVALIAASLVKVLFLLVYAVLLVYFIYGLNILSIGWPLGIFVVSLTISGWSMGIITTALLSFFGQKIQNLAWVLGYFFAPFSAVYYPVSSLPAWAQAISYSLPMTYIFETMREYLTKSTLNIKFLVIGNILNIAYFLIALLVFNLLFNRTKRYGLARLERFE